MIKLSTLFSNNLWGAYIIGTIYAFQYKKDNDFISLFAGRNQKSTNHQLDIKIFYDQIDRVEKFYNVEIKKFYSSIYESKNLDLRLNKWAIGLYSIVKNDINEDIYFKILEKINLDETFTINFLRGVIDSRSSGDKTANYISMDIKKENSVSFAVVMAKAFDVIFGRDNIQYNINPRFKQPSKKSRKKNPQFRIPYQIVFGKIGTFRIQFLEKAMSNKGIWPKLVTNTNIPEKFNNIIIWDTSNISYSPRSKRNITLLQGDVEYLKNYSSKNEGNLYLKLKETYSAIYNNSIKKRTNLDIESIKQVLAKTNEKDFLEPTKKIEKNKKGEPLIDIHHIIPYKYSYLFEEKKTIDNIKNLVPLRPDTHYFLHRGKFDHKKIHYLEILFKEIEPFLNEQNLNKKIGFLEFKNMY